MNMLFVFYAFFKNVIIIKEDSIEFNECEMVKKMAEVEILKTKDNLADGLVGIHRVITRGFQITDDTLQHMLQQTALETQYFNGFLDYLRSLITLIHAHHSTEDKIVFPMFGTKTLEAPYDLLTKGHVKMEALINEIKPLIDRLANDVQDTGTITKIHTLIQACYETWASHIEIEECRFSEHAIGTHLSLQEQKQIAQEIGQHMAQTAKPDYLILPFIVYNLAESDRPRMRPFLPPNITALLTTWNNQWASMKPFLLD